MRRNEQLSVVPYEYRLRKEMVKNSDSSLERELIMGPEKFGDETVRIPFPLRLPGFRRQV